MSETDIEYYRRRASEERKLALKSERSDVAAIHRELAMQYQTLIDHPELRPRLRWVHSEEATA